MFFQANEPIQRIFFQANKAIQHVASTRRRFVSFVADVFFHSSNEHRQQARTTSTRNEHIHRTHLKNICCCEYAMKKYALMRESNGRIRVGIDIKCIRCMGFLRILVVCVRCMYSLCVFVACTRHVCSLHVLVACVRCMYSSRVTRGVLSKTLFVACTRCLCSLHVLVKCARA